MKRKAIVATVVLSALMVATPVLAQRGNGQGGTGDGNPGGRGLGLVCSTTDYTALVAKTLGMTATELRVALKSDQTVQDIETTKNVSLDTLKQAVKPARKADLDQEEKDGLRTQKEADAMLNKQKNAPTPPQGNNGT